MSAAATMFSLLSARIFLPSSTLVPSRRTTSGTLSPTSFTAALKIILSDPAVRAVLVNIFGGIMKCDVIANGIVAAAKQVGLAIPLVVRLEGTNVELGKDILAHSELDIIPADDLGDAARKVVAAARAA